MRISLLQLNFQVGDLEGNLEKIYNAAITASKDKPDLIVTSELALVGYPPQDLLLNHSFIAKTKEKVIAFAARMKDLPPLLLGAPEENTGLGKPLFNSCFLLKSGQVKKSFQKTLLPNYDVFDESRWFASNPGPQSFKLNGKHIGVTICEDIWADFPFEHGKYHSNPMEDLQKSEVDFVINLSSSPFALGKQKVRADMLSLVAKKNHVPIVYLNQIGGNDQLIFDGGSMVIGDDGTVLKWLPRFSEAIETITIGETKPVNLENAPPKFVPLKNTLPPEMAREEECFEALVLGLRDYIKKCGFSKVVLGLSGGIDSALTAALAVEALGANNVFGIMMPSPYSSEGSISDSLELAKRLKIETQLVPIAPIMESFKMALNPKEPLTEENLQARIRGNLLMATSNETGAMLLTTGNKSELSVGYCTIYGDMAGGLAVISDLPKNLVYSLSRWINANKGDVIPLNIIEKAPSAELRPDQTDQDSLPEYDVLDAILKGYIEKHQSQEELAAQGFNAAEVAQIARLVKIAEFKRKQAAPGLKVTDRAFGSGWRMPIASL
ncbi:MAG: NAD+ synthase [SAR324 cluster bacterium]|nr:NAD+ synthase [SAR324 cluster bacterium]